jgi:transposase
VVNPADVPRSNKQDWQKTDRIDSRNLCKHLSDGNLRGIYVPGERQEQLRALFRRRVHLARNLRSIKNHIKSQLLYFGIKLPDQFDNPKLESWDENLDREYKMEIQQCSRKYEEPVKAIGIYVVRGVAYQ